MGGGHLLYIRYYEIFTWFTNFRRHRDTFFVYGDNNNSNMRRKKKQQTLLQ